MSSLSDAQIDEILFQSDVDSYPLRTNFNNLKTAINDNQTQITNLAVAASGAEVTNARNNLSSLKDNIEARKAFGNRVATQTSFQITEMGTPTNTVQAAAGTGIVNGIGIYKASSTTSGTIAASASGKSRIDVVVLESDNNLTIVSGTETAGTPAWPVISSSQMVLAHFTVDDTSPVVINDSDITDDRIPVINPFDDWGVLAKEFTYDGNDDLTDITVTMSDNTTENFNVNYTGDLITSIDITIDGVTYTETYTYDGNDFLTNVEFTIS